MASSYPRFETDSASIFLRYLAENLNSLGVSVTVLAPAGTGHQQVLDSPVSVNYFGYFPKKWQRLAYGSGALLNLRRSPLLWLQAPAFMFGMSLGIRRLIKQTKPDLLHAHWIVPAGLACGVNTMIFKIPTIVTGHGADAFALNSPWLKKLKHFAINKSTIWTTNTNATASAISSPAIRTPLEVIPMGVDVTRFMSGNRSRLRADLSTDVKIILFVGRLVEKKGVAHLIRAIAELSRAGHINLRLWIVGDGEDRAKLERQGKELDIQDVVKFWGKVDNSILPDFYAAADVFVAPSIEASSGDTEGQGVVFIEAFSAALPVIGTRAGGIPEVITHNETGLLVEPGCHENLQRALEHLLSDDQLAKRIANNAQQHAKEKYDWPVIAGRFKDLYQRVVAIPNSPSPQL